MCLLLQFLPHPLSSNMVSVTKDFVEIAFKVKGKVNAANHASIKICVRF